MLRISRFSHLLGGIRRSSEVTTFKQAPSKFSVVGGKFVRVESKDKQDQVTHTGQFFEQDDWRRNRFIDRKKLVNPNWGINLVAEIPPIEVEGRIAVCDGRESPDHPTALGHPRVYINLVRNILFLCLLYMIMV
nr:NADH dehydrogenase [ubiquinone] iron-sulfur protein 6, mitochondrial-like [Ciona intestinalis]|eukprot:XP_026693886.1 NADH dehydrogenase [ubiquinone] iron-sulfur protein 6, mitochondrial-like [Ciona intestinalis]